MITAQDTLAAVIERLNAKPVVGPTAVNLTTDDAPLLAWDFSALKPGDRVFYRAGRRERERMGFFREVSPCGRVVKVYKVFRHSWVSVDDVTGLRVNTGGSDTPCDDASRIGRLQAA